MFLPFDITNQQLRVERYFHSVALQWRELYRGNGLRSEVFSLRQATVLEWIFKHVPLRGADVLDVGCGAGPASVALAIRGARVKAIDPVERMVNLTRECAQQAGVADLVEAQTGDVHALSFADNTLDSAVAVGVIYWLHSPQQALTELFRVLKPGGLLAITADNLQRLTWQADPWNLGSVITLRRACGRMLRSVGLHKPAPEIRVNSYSIAEFDRLIAACGFEKVMGATVGFGPFTLFDRKFIPEAVGTMLHRRLQKLADQRYPFLANRGNHYIVLARKPL